MGVYMCVCVRCGGVEVEWVRCVSVGVGGGVWECRGGYKCQ